MRRPELFQVCLSLGSTNCCVSESVLSAQVDFVSLSFTRGSEDVKECARFLRRIGSQNTKIVAKARAASMEPPARWCLFLLCEHRSRHGPLRHIIGPCNDSAGQTTFFLC